MNEAGTMSAPNVVMNNNNNNNNNATERPPPRAPALVRLLNLTRERRARLAGENAQLLTQRGTNNSTGTSVNNNNNGTPPTTIRPSPTTHLNVSCDECGEMPIVGTRYKSTVQPNYDVCRHCLEEKPVED